MNPKAPEPPKEAAAEANPEPQQLKTVSAPLMPISEPVLETQISAPSYFHSLAENDLPPFRIPVKEARPKILLVVDPLVSEEDVVEMIASTDEDPVNGMKTFLGPFLVRKQVIKNFDLTERDFLIKLLTETVDYAAQRDFNEHKLSCLITIYLTTHMYFKWFYWAAPRRVWDYFKELMIRHTIEDSPDGEEVFEPDECYDIVTHFHTMYITNLPLVHIATFGAHRVKLSWPFMPVKNK
ncbi:uncharacterized protein LOC126367505 [Pectinophora gossypiella]|uniref:uncharacterized protein LOC126367505 n=1 Tax=Pectinophora gossypiella TaxID=13191 RepID=UPI00214E7A8F|nr:uncharacterized protein LOC126367505 [Pectinophora gossypiella]